MTVDAARRWALLGSCGATRGGSSPSGRIAASCEDVAATRARALMDQELLAMADDITRHPEVGHKEERSVKILTDYLRAHDFDVETGVAGLKTAFVPRRASYSRMTPRLGPGVPFL